MLNLIKCNSNDEDFQSLIKKLDLELNDRNGIMQNKYNKYNIINTNTVIIAKEDNKTVGCGCFKEYECDIVEIKRMYVDLDYRKQGISKKILHELEIWADELKYKKVVLETGKYQEEAIGLYKRCEYKVIENYGQYVGMENSICFEKEL